MKQSIGQVLKIVQIERAAIYATILEFYME